MGFPRPPEYSRFHLPRPLVVSNPGIAKPSNHAPPSNPAKESLGSMKNSTPRMEGENPLRRAKFTGSHGTSGVRSTWKPRALEGKYDKCTSIPLFSLLFPFPRPRRKVSIDQSLQSAGRRGSGKTFFFSLLFFCATTSTTNHEAIPTS